MFGRGWESGQATIVALKEVWTAAHEAGTVGGGAKLKTYEFLADVEPAAGGALFRTTMHEPFDERHWRRPVVGDVVAVKCNPGRQKAKFDTSAESAGQKAQKRADKDRRAAQAAQFDALANAAPGTPPPSTAAQPGTEMAGEPTREPSEAGPSSAKADLTRVMIAKARGKGDAAEVERLTAVLADLESGGGSESTAS
jgi:hypothetical protein